MGEERIPGQLRLFATRHLLACQGCGATSTRSWQAPTTNDPEDCDDSLEPPHAADPDGNGEVRADALR